MQGGIDEEEHEVLYVGCLPVEIEPNEQEVTWKSCIRSYQICGVAVLHAVRVIAEVSATQMVALELYSTFNCFPVFLGPSLKERYYKGMQHLTTVQLPHPISM